MLLHLSLLRLSGGFSYYVKALKLNKLYWGQAEMPVHEFLEKC